MTLILLIKQLNTFAATNSATMNLEHLHKRSEIFFHRVFFSVALISTPKVIQQSKLRCKKRMINGVKFFVVFKMKPQEIFNCRPMM
jgi:hypothetical protein